MKIAILADIRANESALRAVLEHLDLQGVSRIWVIGSLVSYGPDPVRVVDLIKTRVGDENCLIGHPDPYILADDDLAVSNWSAHKSFQWARQRLRPRWWSGFKTRRRWTWLRHRASLGSDGGWQFFSCTPMIPGADFLPTFGPIGRNDLLTPHFTLVDRGAFVGALGRPGIAFADTLEWQDVLGSDARITISNRKFIACPGSVGQPRDGNPEAAYAIFDGDSVSWHRVAYNFHETRSRIESYRDLDRRHGERLALGR